MVTRETSPGRLFSFLLTIRKEFIIYDADLHTRDEDAFINIGINNAII